MAKGLKGLAPRYCYYPDKGCEFYPSCLTCPFVRCVFDESRIGVIKAKKKGRNEEIRERFYKGESILDLAIAFEVSIRTIRGVVKRDNKDG